MVRAPLFRDVLDINSGFRGHARFELFRRAAASADLIGNAAIYNGLNSWICPGALRALGEHSAACFAQFYHRWSGIDVTSPIGTGRTRECSGGQRSNLYRCAAC